MVATAFATLGFFLPFSSAGVAIAIGALLVLSLCRPRVVIETQPWKEPTIAVGLLLLAYIAIHTLWSAGVTRASLSAVNHYQELFAAPLLLALLKDSKHRRIFIRCVYVGATLLALVHWAALLIPALSSALSSRRISTGFVLALCAFLLLMQAREKRRRWPARALSAFLALTVLFAVDARTGYAVLLVLASCAAWWHSPPRWRWLAAVAGPLLVLALAMGSGAVGSRLQETLDASRSSVPGETLTSTAIRMHMMQVAADLVRRHLLVGAGFPNYSAVHEQAARARYGADPVVIKHASGWARTSNPHNEYLMQLVGGGIVALALFLLWLALPLRAAGRARPPLGNMLTGLVLGFATACMFNSLLLDFVEGHFYMALLAWLLAEHRYASADEPDAAGVRRIVVIATRQIGDVLLTTPLIHAARERWPQARIDVLGFEGTLGMLRGNPEVNELIATPARLGTGGVRLFRRLWRRYDLALVTDPGDRAHLMGWIAAPRRSGIIAAEGGSNWWKKLLLEHVVVSAGDLGSVHAAREKQALLEPWLGGGQVGSTQVAAPPGAPLPAAVQAALTPGFVVVHAPSMWPYKQWPLPHFRALVQELLRLGRQIVLTGSSSERDQQCVSALRDLASAPMLIDLSGQLDFNQLVTLFGSSALYIGPDTSVSHLAAATGVPVIAVLGPTNPQRWAPWPARASTQAVFKRSAGVQHVGNVTIVQGGLACIPCGRAGCEDHRQSRSDCLDDITPEQVLEEAFKVLGQR